MPENEEQFYEQVVRRISRIILVLGIAVAAGVAAVKGFKTGLAFLIGASISYASFWGWRQIVAAFGPNPKKRTAWFFVFRLVGLVALAYAIIKILGLNIAAAALGLLVSGAAVVLEIIYELIYAS